MKAALNAIASSEENPKNRNHIYKKNLQIDAKLVNAHWVITKGFHWTQFAFLWRIICIAIGFLQFTELWNCSKTIKHCSDLEGTLDRTQSNLLVLIKVFHSFSHYTSVYTPSAVYANSAFPLLYILVTFGSVRPFNFCQFGGCVMVSHYCSSLHFPEYLYT